MTTSPESYEGPIWGKVTERRKKRPYLRKPATSRPNSKSKTKLRRGGGGEKRINRRKEGERRAKPGGGKAGMEELVKGEAGGVVGGRKKNSVRGEGRVIRPKSGQPQKTMRQGVVTAERMEKVCLKLRKGRRKERPSGEMVGQKRGINQRETAA